MNLKSMSIDKLSKLREQVDAALSAKVIEERRTVQAELGRLSVLQRAECEEEVEAALEARSLQNTAILKIRARLGRGVG
jgi:hypothetical protein